LGGCLIDALHQVGTNTAPDELINALIRWMFRRHTCKRNAYYTLVIVAKLEISKQLQASVDYCCLTPAVVFAGSTVRSNDKDFIFQTEI
jgi:hypothetical protein